MTKVTSPKKKKVPKKFAQEIMKASQKKRDELLMLMYNWGKEKEKRKYVVEVLSLITN